MRKGFFAALGAAFLLSACGLTPQGDALRAALVRGGATAADRLVENSVWALCQAAPIGAVRREFGRAPEVYDKFCETAQGAGLIGPPAKGAP